MISLGVDPGKTGALALVADKATKLLGIWDMPVRQVVMSGGKIRHRVDTLQLREVLDDVMRRCENVLPDRIILEQVGPSPRDGVSGSFAFGWMFGAAHTVLVSWAGCLEKVELVPPTRWKPAMGVPGSDKKVSLTKARGLWGMEHFGLAKHDGRADAALLASYGVLVA